MRPRSHYDPILLFYLCWSEPWNSFHYIMIFIPRSKKCLLLFYFLPIFFHLVRKTRCAYLYLFGPIWNDSIIDRSAIQYGWIYPVCIYMSFALLFFPRYFISNTGTVDIDSSFLSSVLSPSFPNETIGISHSYLNCNLISIFILVFILIFYLPNTVIELIEIEFRESVITAIV